MISEAYREEQTNLHESNSKYGIMSVLYAPLISELINKLDIKDVLDYGAGKGRLAEALILDHDTELFMYEPAKKEWAVTPDPHELVVCVDVLEHIEPEHLDAVIADLVRVTKRYGFFTVHTGPARKVLSDGRNAHLTQKPIEWWFPKLTEHFKVKQLTESDSGFWTFLKKKDYKISKAKELPRSTELQVEAFLAGRKPSVLFMNYDSKDYLPDHESFDIGYGELVVSDKKYLDHALRGQLGYALGYGIPTKIGDKCLTIYSKDGEVVVDITTDGSVMVEEAARIIAGDGYIKYRDTAESVRERREYWGMK